ncbi:unnamed protein product [Soboliphyme baturini]|uniref:Uncharacterized protein n=1 Tax=Soboliphyme baturini TaxID=241478 RepID=A0A183I9H0_9BILA|nr:unnamed protein product [Soboliphyme baturini]
MKTKRSNRCRPGPTLGNQSPSGTSYLALANERSRDQVPATMASAAL